uniref:Uncharacterized protein n=1 Tax=Rhizophora mucronata TaxID=61149 RepID=A0A2P2R4I6_RHIMU
MLICSSSKDANIQSVSGALQSIPFFFFGIFWHEANLSCQALFSGFDKTQNLQPMVEMMISLC